MTAEAFDALPPVGVRHPRFEASREQREELATGFFAAAEDGDLRSGSYWPSSSAATAAARRPPPHVPSTAAPVHAC
jgi:hypothetical protein